MRVARALCGGGRCVSRRARRCRRPPRSTSIAVGGRERGGATFVATQWGWESLSPLKGDATSNEIQSVLSTWQLSAWFLSTWILSQLLLSSWPSAFVRARMRAWHTHHVPEQLTCNWLSLRAGHTHHVLEQLTCIWLSCCAISTATITSYQSVTTAHGWPDRQLGVAALRVQDPRHSAT